MDLGKLSRFAQVLGGALRSPASPGNFARVSQSDHALSVSFEADPSSGWEALELELPNGFEIQNQVVSRFSRIVGFQAAGDPEDLRRGFEELGYEWTPQQALHEIGGPSKGDVLFIDLGAGAHATVSGVVVMITQVRATPTE